MNTAVKNIVVFHFSLKRL